MLEFLKFFSFNPNIQNSIKCCKKETLIFIVNLIVRKIFIRLFLYEVTTIDSILSLVVQSCALLFQIRHKFSINNTWYVSFLQTINNEFLIKFLQLLQ